MSEWFDPALHIHKAIVRAGLTQRDAAQRLGISAQYLSDIIKGRRRVSPELVDLVCSRVEEVERDALHADLTMCGAMADGWQLWRLAGKDLSVLREDDA